MNKINIPIILFLTMTTTQDTINRSVNTLNENLKRSERTVYDPRIINDDVSSRTVWTSESVNLAIQGLQQGYKLKENPYYTQTKRVKVRKSGLSFQLSKEEEEVFEFCLNNKEDFAESFVKLKDGAKGWSEIDLRPYQRNLLRRYKNNRWNIVMFPRQSGKTTTTLIEIVHFLCFNVDKDCIVIAQSDNVINEIYSKLLQIFQALPFFMQPGFKNLSDDSFELDNGCRFKIGIASESVVQGYSLDLLIIDEFAYIKNNLIRKFWNNVYPTTSNNPNSRIIILSTPNGRNFFWEMWVAAESGKSFFKNYRIYWYDVPGRDERWKLETIANMCHGDMVAWEMGFECSFDTELKSIFNVNTQKVLRQIQLEMVKNWSKNNDAIGSKLDIEFIDKNIIKYDLKNDYLLIGVDLGEGLEQDYTIFKIKKIDWCVKTKQLIYRSIGIFKSNTISVEDSAQLLADLMKHINTQRTKIVVENNTYGAEFFLQLNSLKMNDINYSSIDFNTFAQFERKSKNAYEYGIRWNAHNKKLAVKSFSQLVIENKLQETHYTSIEEYLNFGKLKNNTYAAQYGHDDLVMADVSISHFIKTNNLFANTYLKEAEIELRTMYNDESVERKREKEIIANREKYKYKVDGYEIRDHAKEVAKREGSPLKNMFIFGIN